MAKYDKDDFGFLDGGSGQGSPIAGLLQMLAGVLIFMTSLGLMFYETEKGLSSHSLRAFQTTFALVLLFGIPLFALGIWLYKRGKRIWKGLE